MRIKALVVDNNPVLLTAISKLLSQEGCEVRAAETGLDALEILKDFQPDILFTDLIMPQVSGEQLCRILRNTSSLRNVFIVVISAIVLEDRERILREVECDLCIAKGNLQEIRSHLRDALEFYRTRQLNRNSGKSARIPESLLPSDVTSELLDEKKHLGVILDNLDEGILEMSESGKIIFCNEGALRILSLREEDLVGALVKDAVGWGSFSHAVSVWMEQQLVGGLGGSFEIFEHAPLFYNEHVITASFIVVVDDGSRDENRNNQNRFQNRFGLCILRNITRQYSVERQNKELDDAFRFARKMEALSCMAGGVAHDFNNLLAAICGNLDILTLLGDHKSPEEHRTLVEQARKAALVAADLTRQISCFSNFGIISREQHRIGELVEKALDDFLGEDRRRCIYQPGDCGNVLISADAQEICQSLINVLQNGREASPHGILTVALSQVCLGAPQLMRGQYIAAGRYVRIDVTDEGQGMKSEQLSLIFDPYYSTKQRGALKGMGLGLTVVYSVLRNHGGYVVVNSRVGRGTQVSFFIPMLRAQSQLERAQSSDEKPRFVLMLDSDRRMLEIGRIMLSHLGYIVITANDRKTALSELRRHTANKALTAPLVIVDLGTHADESAVETAKQMHDVDPDLQIVIMSGTVLDPVMEEYGRYGFSNALAKPYTMDSLKHVLSSTLQH